MQTPFTIMPRVGLGDLRFGMTKADIKERADPLGGVTSGDDEIDHLKAAETTIEKFGSMFTDADKAALLEHARYMDDLGHESLVLGDGVVVMGLKHGSLQNITLSTMAREAQLDGMPVFDVDIPDLIRRLENLNEGPGAHDTTAARLNTLAVMLTEFTELQPGVGPRALPLDKADLANKTFGFSVEPFEVLEFDADKWKTHHWG